MRKNVTNLISPWVHWTSITNRVFSLLHRSRAFYHYKKKNVTKLISTRVLWTSITNRVLSRFDRFMSYLNCMSKIITKLISLWVLCTSITDRVLIHVTVVRHFTTVWVKVSQNSSLRESCAQVSQFVFQAYFDCFNAFYNCMNKIVTKLIYQRVLCTTIRNRVLSWFDRLKIYCNCMRKNVTKLYISASSVHKYHKSCSLLIWPFYGLLQQYEIKITQNWNLCQFCAQVSQNVLLADLTVLQLITTVWAKMSQNSYLRELCAQVSQNVFLADLNVSRHSLTVWVKL